MHGLHRAVARKAETGIHKVSKSKGFGVHATEIQVKLMIPEMWSSLPGNWGLKRERCGLKGKGRNERKSVWLILAAVVYHCNDPSIFTKPQW